MSEISSLCEHGRRRVAERCDFASEGECLAGRVLAKEARAGTEHYVPGQWDVTLHVGGEDFFSHESQDIARITYVDAMGYLCVVLALREPSLTGEWRATWVSRAGQTFNSPARRVDSPDEFPLTAKMLTLLAEAKPSPWPIAEITSKDAA
jgi:hypothetical protein